MYTSTPEPHLVPGYQGHCPQYNYYVGGTYGHLTHRALLSPCIPHGKDINLTVIHKTKKIKLPTNEEKAVLKSRQNFVDAVFKHPIIPGYTGYVPRLAGQIGKRFMAAATSAIVEHEEIMEVKRCEHRNLVHDGIMQSKGGLFESHMNERLMPKTKYRAPLIPVTPKSRSTKLYDKCIPIKDKLPYSKFTVPHFKEDDDEEKYIINGYCGHIPNAKFLFGAASKSLTHTALNQFTDNIRHRRYEKFAEMDDIECEEAGCSAPDCEVYRTENNMIAKYSGHIPGRIFQVGKRSAIEMLNAKHYLRCQRLAAMQIPPPRCGEQCR